MWFDSLRAFHTTDKRPAFHLESRPYGTGYNDLEDCRYRCPVLLVLLCLNSYSPPFHQGQAFRSELHYSVVKVLWFTILIIQQKERLCINRMNLYLRDIYDAPHSTGKQEVLSLDRVRGLYRGQDTGYRPLLSVSEVSFRSYWPE